MRILFDQGTPVPLRRYLSTHATSTSYEMGWSKLSNGDLLTVAEASGFDLPITTDQSLSYQQNLTSRVIAIIVLSTTSWPRIKKQVALVTNAVNARKSGAFQIADIPH